MSAAEIVIIGAGPAGMMLAYQLVRQGVHVRVLERHPDFEREFRGELIGPSVMPVLESLGLMLTLVERGLARAGVERRMFVGRTRRVTLPSGNELGALVSQPGLLQLLHELCSRHPTYRLDFGTTVLRAVREGKDERVVAVETRSDGKDDRVTGDVFVACNGRNSRLRRDVGLTVELDETPGDTIWLRFDFEDAKEALPKGVDVHMLGKGVVAVLFETSRSRLQIAYSAPGDMGALRKDIPALREALLPCLSEPIRSLVAAKLDDKTETQMLKVSIDRLAKWHVPGLLLIGDAAHTMGPAAAQGLNLAIRDSIVTANHFLDATDAKKPIDEDVFSAIEAERKPEIAASQAVQLRAYGMVQKPLVAQHMMFTMLGAVMLFKKFPPPSIPAVELRDSRQSS